MMRRTGRPAALGGLRLRMTYESGLVVEGEYATPASLRWRCIAGPDAGRTGEESLQAVELGEGRHFLNWVEKGGLTVSQVLDLGAGTVVAFVTYDGTAGREGVLDRGRIEILD